ncbi:MAG: hypothetical protein KDH17_18785 [Rhodocyclaceae bacterium]|nr:hypothetical protein [Rhodocyclaceae bacterium]
MYEQLMKTWQAPQQTGLWSNPWQALGAAMQQSMALQRQWAEQFTGLFCTNDASRQMTLAMLENTSKFYLAAVESQIGWWRSLTPGWTPLDVLAQAPAWMESPAARRTARQADPAEIKLEVVGSAPAPAVAATVATVAPRSPAAKDDLKQIAGIGPGLEKKLNAEGIVTFRQIAEFTDSDIARLEQTVIKFPGRIERDGWVAQARKLADAQ